jgi:hypothetical protein
LLRRANQQRGVRRGPDLPIGGNLRRFDPNYVDLFVVTIEDGKIQGTVTINGSFVTLSSLTIDGTGATSDAMIIDDARAVTLNNVIVQNFTPALGIVLSDGAPLTIDGGEITGMANCALLVNGTFGPSSAILTGNVQITGNSLSFDGNDQGGVCVNKGGVVTVQSATLENNGGGPAITVTAGTLSMSSGTVSSPALDPTTSNPFTFPAVVAQEGKLLFFGGTVTGGGNASAIYAAPGSSIQMQGTTVTDNDANDATILVADGSSLASLGGNTISNTASGGTAISVTNGSSFHQRLEAVLGTNIGNTAQADTITGAGIAEIESNIELGTGASAASTWNGSIDAAQNSSIRMDGGITVNGSVTLAQASNGFFNLGNTGSNVVTGGVLCPFSTNQAAHVTGSATTVQLTQGGAIAVTFGTAANNCLRF